MGQDALGEVLLEFGQPPLALTGRGGSAILAILGEEGGGGVEHHPRMAARLGRRSGRGPHAAADARLTGNAATGCGAMEQGRGDRAAPDGTA